MSQHSVDNHDRFLFLLFCFLGASQPMEGNGEGCNFGESDAGGMGSAPPLRKRDIPTPIIATVEGESPRGVLASPEAGLGVCQLFCRAPLLSSLSRLFFFFSVSVCNATRNPDVFC